MNNVLSLVSWNTAGAQDANDAMRPQAIARYLAQIENVDAILLQEVSSQLVANLVPLVRGWRLFSAPRPSSNGSFEALCILIPDNSMLLESKIKSIVLTNDPTNPEVPALDARYPRIAQVVRATCAGNRLGVVNIHLDKRGARSRLLAQTQICDELSDAVPAIIAGDFNEISCGPVGRALRKEGFRGAKVVGEMIAGPYGVVVDHAFGRLIAQMSVVYQNAGNLSDHPVLRIRARLNGGS